MQALGLLVLAALSVAPTLTAAVPSDASSGTGTPGSPYNSCGVTASAVEVINSWDNTTYGWEPLSDIHGGYKVDAMKCSLYKDKFYIKQLQSPAGAPEDAVGDRIGMFCNTHDLCCWHSMVRLTKDPHPRNKVTWSYTTCNARTPGT